VSGVKTIAVESGDAGIRLDRWFKKHYPDLTHGRLQKLLRTGQVRLDGGRAKTGDRVQAGQEVRVPPLGDGAPGAGREAGRKAKPAKIDPRRAEELRRGVLYRDGDLLIIDKPAGLAVQGGSKTDEHLDAYLDELRFGEKERPRLVHRLDKDTSGVLALARNGGAARRLTAAFRGRDARKLYWAVAVGVPGMEQGHIDARLDKRRTGTGERMTLVDDGEGQRAETLYQVIARSGRVASWLAMEPLTGRTHQLRVHAADVLGCPIVGDGKYGGAAAFLQGDGISRGLHLHARGIRLSGAGGKVVEAFAPLPPHMAATFAFLGFHESEAAPGFLDP
jgi:23S rRNA pseudouridine955/2504/2580 synthase